MVTSQLRDGVVLYARRLCGQPNPIPGRACRFTKTTLPLKTLHGHFATAGRGGPVRPQALRATKSSSRQSLQVYENHPPTQNSTWSLRNCGTGRSYTPAGSAGNQILFPAGPAGLRKPSSLPKLCMLALEEWGDGSAQVCPQWQPHQLRRSGGGLSPNSMR